MKQRILALSLAILLAGCAAGEGSPPPDQPPTEPPAASAEPVVDRPGETVLVDDPASPYPMAVETWTIDMDGDGTEELVELRAEKAYSGSETEPNKWLEVTEYGLHPYTVVVTAGETVYELPLGRDSNDDPLLYPWYFSPEDSEYTDTCWTTDRSGNFVLALWFDTMSAGGAGNIDVYAVAFQDVEPVLLPVPVYGIEATLDEETMISRVTVLETGHTETLDLTEWLANCEKRNREHGHDFTFEPIYNEDGSLSWPVAPGNIDGFYHAEQYYEGITLRQYIWGSAHVDGMGALVTTLSWEDGQPVVLDQHFDWDY